MPLAQLGAARRELRLTPASSTVRTSGWTIHQRRARLPLVANSAPHAETSSRKRAARLRGSRILSQSRRTRARTVQDAFIGMKSGGLRGAAPARTLPPFRRHAPTRSHPPVCRRRRPRAPHRRGCPRRSLAPFVPLGLSPTRPRGRAHARPPAQPTHRHFHPRHQPPRMPHQRRRQARRSVAPVPLWHSSGRQSRGTAFIRL